MKDRTTERNPEYVRARLGAMQSQINGIADRLATIEKRAETTTVHFADDAASDRVVEIPAVSWTFDVPASVSAMQQEIDRLKAERDAAIKERDAIAAAARGATRIIAEGLEKAGGAA